MDQAKAADVSRRGLLRRAGTVAVGAGIGTVAAAAVAAPALAGDGDPIVQGQVNTGGNVSTTIVNSSEANAALVLGNDSGAPLALDPTAIGSASSAVGSIFTDEWGGLFTIGDQSYDEDGDFVTDKFVGRLSSSFSTSVLPMTPVRYLVTTPNFQMPSGEDGRTYVSLGSAGYDSVGRVLPKNNNNVPDLVLEFDSWFYENGFVGVQGNLAILSPTANGFISLYDTPVWPGTASMNYSTGQVRDGFVQTGFTDQMTVNFKLSSPAVVVFDIVAFIVGNGTGQSYLTGPNSVSATKKKFGQDVAPGTVAKQNKVLNIPRPVLKKN